MKSKYEEQLLFSDELISLGEIPAYLFGAFRTYCCGREIPDIPGEIWFWRRDYKAFLEYLKEVESEILL